MDKLINLANKISREAKIKLVDYSVYIVVIKKWDYHNSDKLKSLLVDLISNTTTIFTHHTDTETSDKVVIRIRKIRNANVATLNYEEIED